MQSSLPAAQQSWFMRYRSNPAPRLRLLCIPHAGGSPSAYYPWRERLPASVDLLVAQLPGRGARLREPCLTSIEHIVDGLAAAFTPYEDGVPYAIFCHSMGVLVGFELMRRMRRGGRPLPARAFVSGHRAPQLPRRQSSIHDQPDEALLAEVKRLGGTPPEVLDNPELMAMALPILRADYTAVETYRYRPEPPLPVPLVALCGIDDSNVSQSELEAWREQTCASCEIFTFPGDHFYLDSQRDRLLEVVRARL